MYRPPAFREDRIDILHALIAAHPLGTIVSSSASGLTANLLPFQIVANGERGVLRAHLARANDQIEALRAGGEALVIFQGPQAYVSPGWYTSKSDHGKVVPTWNYVVVQAWGRPHVIEDAGWLRNQIDALTAAQEAGRAESWSVADAPAAFVAGQLKGIVGIEIPIARIDGKWKVSQNRADADRTGVVEGLRADGQEAMAALVERG